MTRAADKTGKKGSAKGKKESKGSAKGSKDKKDKKDKKKGKGDDGARQDALTRRLTPADDGDDKPVGSIYMPMLKQASESYEQQWLRNADDAVS